MTAHVVKVARRETTKARSVPSLAAYPPPGGAVPPRRKDSRWRFQLRLKSTGAPRCDSCGKIVSSSESRSARRCGMCAREET